MLKFLKAANYWRGKIENSRLEDATFEPQKAQRKFLLKLLRENAAGVFGRLHNFDKINGVNEFRQNVPVRDYEAFRPFVNRIATGEKSILTVEDPFLLTMTSGTTGEPKFVPVTQTSAALNANLMRQWLYRAELDHRDLTAQSSFGIVSRAVEGRTAAGLPYGSASGLIYKNIPWLVRRAYAVPALVSEIEDYDKRYFALARFALASHVSFIATPNAATLLRLGEVCAANQERLIRAVYDGSLGLELKTQPEIRAKLAVYLKPNPARSLELSRVVTERGFLRLADCWTNLKLLGCWVGGSAGAQISKLEPHFGSIPVRDLGYLSSEAHVTLPVADHTASGVLALQNNFYEFVPEAEIETENPATLLAHELEIGERYGVLLTNAAGLYRYKINDIIDVTGFYHKTPLVAFVRKSGETTNITGEKMYAAHFVSAVNYAAQKYRLDIKQFRVVPDFAANRYDVYLELETPVSAVKLRREVLPAIDERLGAANIEYDQKRRSRRLNAPRLCLMERGWADAHLRRHVAAGKRDTQFKWQILCPEPQPEDSIRVSEIVEAESRVAAVEIV